MLQIDNLISDPYVHDQSQTNLNLLKCQTLHIIQIVLESRIFCIICKFCIFFILPYVEREEHVTDNFPEVVERKSIQCEWTYCCSYVANSTKDMINHVSATHTITSSFVFPDSSKTEICEECGMEFLMDHAYAMHLYTDHKLAFNCDHCLEFIPGCEGGFIEIHMELCTAPCNGDPNCACTW